MIQKNKSNKVIDFLNQLSEQICSENKDLLFKEFDLFYSLFYEMNKYVKSLYAVSIKKRKEVNLFSKKKIFKYFKKLESITKKNFTQHACFLSKKYNFDEIYCFFYIIVKFLKENSIEEDYEDIQKTFFCNFCLEKKLNFLTALMIGKRNYCDNFCRQNLNIIIKSGTIIDENDRHQILQLKKSKQLLINESYYCYLKYIKKNLPIPEKYCSICGDKVKFLSLLKGYSNYCDKCYTNMYRIPKKQNKETLHLKLERIQKANFFHRELLRKYQDLPYILLKNWELKTLSQATWHLEKNDSNCVLGKCINCNKRLHFVSFSEGYLKNKNCTCGKDNKKRIYFFSKKPRVLTLDYLNHKYYTQILRKNTLKKICEIYDIELEKYHKRNKYSKDNKNEEEDYTEKELKKINLLKSILKNPHFLFDKKNSQNPFTEYSIKEKKLKSSFKKMLQKQNNILSQEELNNLYDLTWNKNWWLKLIEKEKLSIDEIQKYTGLDKKFIIDKLKYFNLYDKKYFDKNNKKMDDILFSHNEDYDEDYYEDESMDELKDKLFGFLF